MEERVPSLRNRIERNKPFSLWAFMIILLFFIGILLLLFLRSPFSTITKISIKGNRLIPTETIRGSIPFSTGISYFSVDAIQSEKAICLLPEVKQVDVIKVFPNKVYITVHEKKVIGLIRFPYRLYPVFEDGQILKKSYFNLDMHDKPILEGWKAPNETVRLTAKNLAYLPSNLVTEIDRIQPVENEVDEIQVITKRHHRIFVRASELDQKMKVYPSFYVHPPGKLYLLESIWFKPEKYS